MSPIPLGILASIGGAGGYFAGLFSGNTTFSKLAVDSQNNYVFVGNQSNEGFGSTDGLVVKTDEFGSVIWQKYIGNSGDNSATAVAVDSSDNIYVAVQWKSGSYFLTEIEKLDTNGNIVLKRYFNRIGTNLNEFVYAMNFGQDGYLYLGGSGFEGNFYAPQPFTMKMDTSLNILWTRSNRDGASRDQGSTARYADADASGNMYAAHPANGLESQTNTDSSIVKTNSSGAVQWTRSYYYYLSPSNAANNVGETPTAARIRSDGNIAFFYDLYRNLRLTVFDPSGNTLSTANLLPQNSYSMAMVLDSTDNAYCLASYANRTVVSVDPSGTVLWKRSFSGITPSDIVVDNNGDLVLCGAAFGQPAIIKMAADGSTVGSAVFPEGTVSITVQAAATGPGGRSSTNNRNWTARSITTTAGILNAGNTTKTVALENIG